MITREEAKRSGAKRYFTGEPCAQGHVVERLVSNKSCLECFRLYGAALRKKNPGANAKAAAKWREANPDIPKAWVAANGDKCNAAVRAWNSRNKDKIALARVKRYARDGDKMRAHGRAYAKANPEKGIARYQKRRARKLAAGGEFGAADILRMFDAQDGKCNYCKIPIKGWNRSVDHIIPLSRGGTNDPSNLQLLCRSCNSSKGQKMPEEYTAWLDLKQRAKERN